MLLLSHLGVCRIRAAPGCRPLCSSGLRSLKDAVRFLCPLAEPEALESLGRGGVVSGRLRHLSVAPGCLSQQSVGERSPTKMDSPVLDGAAEAALPASEDAIVAPEAETVVQYVVIRRDLVDAMKWPLGSIISQGCHAAVAAIWLHKDDAQTLQYCASEKLDDMHTVTLEVKGDAQLVNLSKKLEAAGIAHKLWIEQPENIPTCLATKPYSKSQVGQFFKKLKLCK